MVACASLLVTGCVGELGDGALPPGGDVNPSGSGDGLCNPRLERRIVLLADLQFSNAIRDLLDLEVDVRELLPADDESNGFDNIADVQMPSATVMQGYLRAAAYVSRVAVGDPSADASSTQYDVPRTQSQKGRVEGAPFGTRGGPELMVLPLASGEYRLVYRVRAGDVVWWDYRGWADGLFLLFRRSSDLVQDRAA